METRWVMIPLPIQREIQLPIQRGIHVGHMSDTIEPPPPRARKELRRANAAELSDPRR